MLLFLYWLGASWEVQAPNPVTFPSNATVYSHIYTIKLAGDVTEGEGASSLPQEALGPPGSSRGGGLYEHTLDGPDQEHVVFTHRINLPPQSCGCPPGTEDTRDLLKRLQALENEVRTLRDTCQAGSGCCPATARSQASTGQTDIRSLCSHHGSFDLSRCQCECEMGWGGPTCAEPVCSGGCGGPERGDCVNGRCQCHPGYSGTRCEEPPSCPDDCNDQGRCVDGRCSCFPGYIGPSCSEPACPQDCQGHGKCVSGACVCDPGYSGPDCGTRVCPSNCNRRGKDRQGGEAVRLSGAETVFERRGLTPGEEYTITIRAEKGQRYGPPVSQTVQTPPPPRPPTHQYSTPPPSSRLRPDASSAHPEAPKPATRLPPSHNTTSVTKEFFLKKITQNISAKLSPYNGTLLERLESYLRASNFPVQGNRTIENVARDIYIYLIRWKPKEFQERVRERLVKETNSSFPQREFPMEGTDSVYSEGYIRLDHTKPSVIANFPDGIEVSLDGVRGLSDNVIIRFRNTGNGEGGEVMVPGDTSRAVITGLAPGTTYQVEVHGVVKGHSSKSYSFITATGTRVGRTSVFQDDLLSSFAYNVRIICLIFMLPANGASVASIPPVSPTAAKTRPVLSTTRSPEVSLKDLTVTEASPNSLRVSWSAPSSFRGFSLQYRDPQSNATPGEIRVPGTVRSVNVMGLTPRTDYELQLFGEKPNGLYEGPIATKASTAPPAESGKPTLGEISVLEVTDNAARLSWSVATGTFDSFLIQYKDAEGKPKSLPVNGDLREAIISDLVPSRKYKFNLYGLVGRKRHGPVSTEAVTVKPDKRLTAPPGLGELSASDITSDSVRLSWSVPSGSFDSFVIQYKDAEGRPQVLPIEGDTHEVTIPSLAPSHRYRFNLYGISNRKRLGPATKDYGTDVVSWSYLSYHNLTLSHITKATWSSVAKEQLRFILFYIPIAALRKEETTPEAVLGDLSVSDTTSNSVRLTWSIPTGNFDSFLLQYQDSEGNDQSLPVNRDSREVTISNLVPSQRYRFNLYGISGLQRLGPVSADAVTASQETKKEKPGETKPIQPSLGELSVSNVTSDSLLLSWTVRTGSFDSFLIQYKDAEGKTQALPVERDSREITIPNLTPSRRYKFNLYGVYGRKRSGPISTEAITASASGSPVVEAGSPVEPNLGGLSVSGVTSGSILLSWTVRTGSFDSFLIQYKDAEGKTQALPVEGDSRNATIPNLTPSHRYKFNLYGVSGRKRSSPISTEAITASQESKEQISVQPSLGELSVSDVSSNSVRLSWTIPTGSFASFLVQYKDAEGKSQALTVKGDSREVIIPNLSPSRRYKFNLYGVDGRKRSGPISTDATTASITVSQEDEEQTAVQPSLGELSVSDTTCDSVRLSWTVRTGSFDSFLVQYKDAEGKPQALPVVGDAREIIVSSLVPSRRYKFNLYGVSGRKRSVTTQLSLDRLSVTEVTNNSVRLSWLVPTGDFDSFLVQYKDPEGRLQVLPVDGVSRTFTVPNLEPSQRYKFNLYGVFGSKRYGPLSTMALTASLMEKPTPPLRLGQLTANNAMPNSLDLSWTVEEGTFDSFIIQYRDAQDKPQALPVNGSLRSLHLHDLVPSHRYQINLYGVLGRKRLGPISTEAETAPAPAPKDPPVPPSLGELSASDITSNSVHLSWTVPTGSFDSFQVQYKDAEGKPQAIPVEGVFREIIVPDLVPSRRYKFNLYGLTGRKRLGPISTDAVTVAPPAETRAPPSLGQLSVSNITSNSVHLTWTVRTGNFDSFLIQYKDAEGKPQALPLDGSTRRFDSFLIQYKDAEGKPQSLPMEGASREVTVSNLAPSRRYKFNLFGVSNRKRFGPVSSEATTAQPEEEEEEKEEEEKMDEGHKPRLGELLVSETNSDSVHLSWSVPVGRFDSFLVQYEDGEDDVQTLPVDGGSREVTVPNLVPSQRYRFDLYGISGGETLGPISTDTFTVPLPQEQQVKGTATPPPEPNLGELSVSDVTSDSVRLSWDVPRGTFDSFVVKYTDAASKPQEIPADKGTNSVVIYYLVPSYRYTFYLYGISERRLFGPVSISIVTAPGKTGGKKHQEEEADKEVPTGTEPRLGMLTVSEVTNNAARLTWTVPLGAFDSFSIQYKDAEGRPQALPVEGGFREVMIPNLVPSHKYRFNLYGISGQRRLGPISANAVTTALTTTHDGKSQEVGEEAVKEVPTGTEPRLGELTVSEVTSNTARLTWTVLLGTFDSFSIQYKDAEGRLQMLSVGGDSREVMVSNLVPSHKYRFNLYGLSGQRRLGPISANAVTTATTGDEKHQEVGEEAVKEVPTGTEPQLGELTVSKVTSKAAHLTWTVPLGTFDSFSIQYKDAEGRPRALLVEGGSREVTVPNLVPSHKYRFNLYGISGQRRLGPISANAVTTAAETPRQATEEEEEEKVLEEPSKSIQPSLGDLTVSEVTPDSLLLSWSIQEGSFDSFLIQYKDAAGKLQMLPVDGAMRSLHLYNLTPSQRYKFNVFGVSGQKRPGTKQESRAQLKLGELSARDVTAESLLLSWTVETGNFDSFIIQYRDSDGKPHALPVDGSLRSMKLHDLVPSHKYRFNLYGVSGRKRFGPVSTEAITAASEKAPPPRPSLGELSTSDINSTSIRLSWNVLTGNFDSFIVQYRDAEGKPQVLPVDRNSRGVVISNLVSSHRYKFNLYGISGRKRIGPISTEAVTERMEEPEIHPTLGDLFISEVTKDSVRLSWTIPAGRFDSFLVQYKDAEGKPQSVPVDADARTVVISNLMDSHRYKFNLYGILGRKRLGPISTDAVTAFPDAPNESASVLERLVVTEVMPTSLQLTWEVPEGEFDTFLVRYKESLLGSGKSPPPAKEVTVSGDERSTVLQLDSPRDLRFSDIRETSVVANWRAPSSRIDRYKVSFQPTDGGEPQSISVDGSKLRTTIEGLTPGASYEVTVVSIRGFEESEPLVGYVTTEHLTYPFPRDCSEESLNGPGPSRVFQRRMNGETDFWRDWQDYATGFGNLTREFWLGNDALHQLTSSGDYELRVDLHAGNESVYATYQSFRVDSPADYYRLHLGSDAFSYHSGSVFSTRDRDPNRVIIPCAVSYRGAWWYRNCHYVNLNGLYANNRDHQGINWFNWKGFEFSIPFTEMKLRPRGFQPLRRA
ncbi:hypothetical protein JD844_013660 [Phrynosoma platyrhinos]|uniref:Tenascin XB n=1 Tax=Phrynosoma platyrhinos TaxID=52577 RepID=A0ABQ7TL42_PHRPL|nr:hypothetical protein JD844_013660 [Phrynosoma platyrhinos]